MSVLNRSIALLELLACVLFVLAIVVWRRGKRTQSFYNVPGPASVSFFTGNLSQLYGPNALSFQGQVAARYGRIVRLQGAFGAQILSIGDVGAITDILVKRQDVFEEAEYFTEAMRVTFGPGLLAVLGDAHRRQRRLMNPAFSTSQMRRIIPIFQSLTSKLCESIRVEIGNEDKEIDIVDYMGRIALELIGQAGLGHTFGALDGKRDAFVVAVKSMVPAQARIHRWRSLLPMVTRTFPPKLLRFVVDYTPWPALQDMKKVTDTLSECSSVLWDEKRTLYAQGGKGVVNEYSEGKDIMSILLRANIDSEGRDRLSDAELIAQMSTFVVAGSDTTASALARIFYLLALHPDVQEKLRQELLEVDSSRGELAYDQLNELPYLDAICRETLRLYPPVYLVQRDVREDCILPLAHPFTDTAGAPRDKLFVPRGTIVLINIPAVNRDTDIWGADAMEWKPSRWLAPLPQSVANARVPGVYANMLTFIGGRRACIGLKFAQLEIKVVLSQLVPTFRFSPSNKEIEWRLRGVVLPSVVGAMNAKAELPLRVNLV